MFSLCEEELRQFSGQKWVQLGTSKVKVNLIKCQLRAFVNAYGAYGNGIAVLGQMLHHQLVSMF